MLLKSRSSILVVMIVCSEVSFLSLKDYAQQSGSTTDAKAKLEQLIDPRSNADKQLEIAVEHCDVAGAEVALKNGAHPNRRGLEMETQLMLVCQDCSNTELAEVLLKNGADPNLQDADGYTALMFARRDNKGKMIELLLKYGAKSS